MVFIFNIKNEYIKNLDRQLNELKINLENNYKDLARNALIELRNLTEKYYADGSIKDKEFNKYIKMVEIYEENMRGYHH